MGSMKLDISISDPANGVFFEDGAVEVIKQHLRQTGERLAYQAYLIVKENNRMKITQGDVYDAFKRI